MNNRVVHFEIPCTDPEKNMKFFSKVFGWKFRQFGTVEYWSVITGDEKAPGINGGLMKRKDPAQPIANSINVENIDEHIKKIEKAGGQIVVPKMAIPAVGWLAYFKDPDGNIHGLYQEDPKAM
ncbi:MAG: VOC family protein [Bacteroidetes bacterium]|nr:VOC family protein [Bacteroidota bacterium]